MIDVHVYHLPEKLRNLERVFPSSENKIVEAIHHHPDASKVVPLAGSDEIEKAMKESEVTQSVLVSFPWNQLDLCKENNDGVLEQCQKTMFSGICSIHPRDPQWRREAERVRDAGAIGLKINADWQGFALDDSIMDDVAEFAKESQLFIMTHIDHPFKKSEASAAHLISLLQRHPETRFLAAHLGGGIGFYYQNEKVREALKNVWFDTAISSTLEMIEAYVQLGLEDRILFGSDFPFNHSHSQAQVSSGIQNLKLTDEQKTKVLVQNFNQIVSY